MSTSGQLNLRFYYSSAILLILVYISAVLYYFAAFVELEYCDRNGMHRQAFWPFLSLRMVKIGTISTSCPKPIVTVFHSYIQEAQLSLRNRASAKLQGIR